MSRKKERTYREKDGTYRNGIGRLNINLASANKIPFTPAVSGNRVLLYMSGSKQSVPLRHPERAIISTAFSKDLERSMYEKMSEGDWQLVDEISKVIDGEVVRRFYVFKDVDTKQIEVFEWQRFKHTADNYGAEMFDAIHDAMVESGKPDADPSGLVAEKGTVLSDSTSFNHGEYNGGLNFVTINMISIGTTEDAQDVSSRVLDTEMIYNEVVEFELNADAYLKNIYGNNEEYYPIPKIGQAIANDVIYAQSRDVVTFRNDVRVQLDDSCRYMDSGYQLYDIEVFYGSDAPIANKYLKAKFDENQTYMQRVHLVLDNLSKVSPLSMEAQRFKELYGSRVNPNEKGRRNRLRNEKDEIRENKCYVRAYFAKYATPEAGQKTTARYGNKGVMSASFPHKSIRSIGVNEDKYVDYIQNDASKYSRTIWSGQCEMEINRIFDVFFTDVIPVLKNKGWHERDMLGCIIKLVKCIEERSAEILEDVFAIANDGEVTEWFKNRKYLDLRLNSISIPGPQGIYDMFSYIKEWAGKELNINKPTDLKEIVEINGIQVCRAVVAPCYIQFLRQCGKKEISTRGVGTKAKSGVLTKNDDFKDYKVRMRETPVKKSEVDTTLDTTLFPPEILTLYYDRKSSAVKVLKAYIFGIGRILETD